MILSAMVIMDIFSLWFCLETVSGDKYTYEIAIIYKLLYTIHAVVILLLYQKIINIVVI